MGKANFNDKFKRDRSQVGLAARIYFPDEFLTSIREKAARTARSDCVR